MNDDLKRVNLRDIVDRISENTIVLPDFQRGFTWKENNRQKALLASVLTKLPIGTVLFLNVKTEDYGYKKIGKNERNIDNLEGKQEVKALLDGQQRITVLTAFLSTKLQRENIDDLVSPTLERRYFLNLPSFQSVINSKKEDLFGGTILSFPNSFRGNYPEISSEEMKERITFVHDRKKAFLYEKAETKDTREIREYCRNVNNSEDGDAYLLPLFYLLDACEPGAPGAVILEDVVKEIGAEYEKSIRSWLQAEEYPIEEKEQYLEKFGLEDAQREAVLEEIKTGTLFLPKEEREDNFSDLLKERKMQWGMHLCEYLRKCIEDIRLYEIAISVNDKKRAIDIYENLNLGGKSLSVFDLILAKASRHTQEKGNLFTQIVDDIERDHREEYTSLLYEALRARLAEYDGDGKKAFAEEFYKPKADGTQGPIVKKVKTYKKMSLGVEINKDEAGVGRGIAENANGGMIRVDVFRENGKYYFVPIYIADALKKRLPNKAAMQNKPYSEWKEMKDENFLFSLYSRDLIGFHHLKGKKVKCKDGTEVILTKELVYYIGANIHTASFACKAHNGKYEFDGLGIQSLKELKKYQVDVLGNVTEVRQEKRRGFQ